MDRAWTRSDLVPAFQDAGLVPGDLVLVHSALSSIGQVIGGAAAVVDALLESVAPGGTLVVPTISFTHPFDPRNTPSTVGAISETVRLRADAVRSLHPIHSVAAIGPLAEPLCAGHAFADTGCGRGSPYHELIERNGKILLLGVDQDRNTTLHTLEYLAKVHYLQNLRLPAPLYPPYNGQGEIDILGFPGGHRDFIGVTPLLRRAGRIRHGMAGQAVIQLMFARDLHDVLMPELRRDPLLFLCENPACDFCRTARQAALSENHLEVVP